ncbi:helix-turn-helix domain-containing protein [Amycolatopsis sp. CA-230715]|uniref:helix-turn-helix domain-containing protein n=1 Tax=Amycolatopsis sp. CA-230715 TaxID=2745196 RepID=UPI001C02E882|nr:helix-turn-helix transcriptional regulator [Amycolatopsis sp. CA-230715]QWF78323.1 hypothetical protein HUW46_01718 [Amycolatopsis sp. CA-230715]
MANGPVTSRVLLGFELRQLREAAAMNIDTVADRTGWFASKIYRSERGEGALRAAEIDELLHLYSASAADAERIREIGVQARRRGSYGKVPEWTRQYYGLEQDASELRVHQGELIPGLIQTEAYARALLSTSKTMAPVDVEDAVLVRLRRQSRLTEPNPPKVHVVLGEAALCREVGGPDALRGQIDHLIEVAKLPNLTLQVLPFAAGAYAALGDGFTLLKVDIGDAPVTWVYLASLVGGKCRNEPTPVRTYELAFATLMGEALSEADSLTLLKRARRR